MMLVTTIVKFWHLEFNVTVRFISLTCPSLRRLGRSHVLHTRRWLSDYGSNRWSSLLLSCVFRVASVSTRDLLIWSWEVEKRDCSSIFNSLPSRHPQMICLKSCIISSYCLTIMSSCHHYLTHFTILSPDPQSSSYVVSYSWHLKVVATRAQ